MLVFKDRRGNIHIVNLQQVVRMDINPREGAIYFWAAGGHTFGFALDDIPIAQLLSFVALSHGRQFSREELQDLLKDGGDGRANRDQDT